MKLKENVFDKKMASKLTFLYVRKIKKNAF